MYTLMNTREGQYSVDWDAIASMVRSYFHAKALNKYATIRSDGGNANGLPDLSSVEVDWDKVREKVDVKTWGTMLRLCQGAELSMETAAQYLKEAQEITRKELELYHDRLARVSAQNQGEIEKYVDSYGWKIKGLQIVRDLCAAFVIGAATSGAGTAAALPGALRGAGAVTGAAIKVYGKYEDTYNAGSTAIEATQQLAFTVLPGGEVVGAGTKIVISAGLDTTKSLVEGKSGAESVLNGVVNFPSAAAGKAAKEALGKLAIPVSTAVKTRAADISKKVVEEAAKKAGKLAIEAGKDGIDNVKTVIHQIAHRLQESASAGNITFWDSLLLKFAIVDMAKGVGHSAW
jgi:hypothetical protein